MILYFFLTYIVREIRKYALYKKMKDSDNRSLLIITTKEAAEKVVSNMEKHNYARFHIAGLAIIDENMVGSSFGGVTVVANRNTAPEYVCKEWIDEVFVVLSPNYGYPKELMEELRETGVTIHLNLAKITNEPGKRQFIEKIGDYTVLTTSLNYSSAKQLCAKRCMDIAGGLAGCILTGVIFLFVAPIIYMQSDLLVLAYHRTYGLPVTISRCSNNYGPYHFPEKLIPLMIANALADKPLPVYGEGLNVRDWLYVEDHCRAIDLIIHNGRVGEVYNVGGHNEMKNIDIVKIICKELGKPESLITHVTDRKGHDMRYAIDPTKIHNELGWLPETKFEDGIKKTIQWYLDNKEWWETIISGEYQNYYEKMYENR